MSTLTTLTPTELEAVAGGIAPVTLKPETVLWQDAYGDTMSGWEHLDWTKREHDPVHGDSIFDFPGGEGRQ